uniref:tRNA/rRNA methyltransferase SpoU type domain-containing protein n=1 Tax=Neogobius melanostomus TaxID=47308 RepID=A0A8C6WQH7_9GOBI
MEVMEVYGYKNLGEMLKVKKAQGWNVVGTVGSESGESQVISCSDFTMTKPTLLLIGGEGGGLSQKLQHYCQTLLTIPAGRQLFTGIESLNVSVATGILLHTLLSGREVGKRRVLLPDSQNEVVLQLAGPGPKALQCDTQHTNNTTTIIIL